MLIDGLFFFSCGGGSSGSDSTTDEKVNFTTDETEGSDYSCSYKLKGPSSGEMNVCWWVDEQNQANEMTSYNTAFTDCSLAMSCTSSGWGVVLFFPRTVGEYTISNISIANN